MRSRRTVGLAVPLIAWLTAVGWISAQPQTASAPAGAPAPVQAAGGVPAATCAECHASIHERWAGARHSKMLQPATSATVLAPFAGKPIQIRGAVFTLGVEGEAYVVRGPFPTQKEEAHRVLFTLGSRRVQHYLTRLRDGRLVVLPPTWDVEKREWFHNLDIVNPDEAAMNPIQVWNRSCYGCHVSGAEKRFDQAQIAYETQWVDFGTSCERCHGNGAAHVAQYRSAASVPGPVSIVTPTRLSPERSTMVCAQCHSLRDITVPGFAAGDDYYDHFTPILEYAQPAGPDPAYWADGRPRRFSNDAIGFWQSQCFVKGGATCLTCHRDPHAPDIDRHPTLAHTSNRSNSLCSACHSSIANSVTSHTRHAAESPGSACVNCHMPRTVISLRARMPDHSIGVPAPENTVSHGIPNACTECHKDRDAGWAVAKLTEWFPAGRRMRLVARADAFAAARRGQSSAVPRLTRLATDDTEPPLVRANAVGYLRRFPGPETETFIAAAASSSHPSIRVTAVLGLGERGFPAATVTPVLINALGDTHRTVRVGSALSLMNARVTTLDGAAGALLESAKRDYISRAILLSDDARVLLDVGKFHLMNKDASAAIRTLETSLRLDASLNESRYFLALAVLTQGRTAEARALLTRIPRGDPYSDAALKLLATLSGGER